MSVLKFTPKANPEKPAARRDADRAAFVDLSRLPRRPLYAMRDFDRIRNRFDDALMYGNRQLSPQLRVQAGSDRRKYPQWIKFTNYDGAQLVDGQDLVSFIHHLSGHPRSWIMSWHVQRVAKAYIDSGNHTPAYEIAIAKMVDAACAADNNGTDF
jgi:hypothetical protein